MATKAKLKIGFVFDDSLDRNDGVQQYVKTLGSWFKKQGHETVYFVGETKLKNWDGGKIYSLSNNFNVKFNANNLTIPLPAKSKKVMNAMTIENPDVLHVQVPYSPFMAQKVINNAPKSAVVGTFHILPAGRLHRFGSRLLGVYYGNKLHKFDKFVSVSPPAKVFAKQVFDIDSDVLPNVVELDKFKTSQKNIQGKIVFLGRLVNRKGAEHLIKACKILNNKNINFELVIAGDGPDRKKLERLTSDLDIQSHVNFLGYISEEEKARLLASAHIACFPSLYGESFGIVLIEAMAAGSRVVLGGNNPGYSSVLEPSSNQLFDPLDHKDLADKLEKFLKDVKSTESAYQWQKEYVKQFDVNVVGEKLESIYYKLLENKMLSQHNNY